MVPRETFHHGTIVSFEHEAVGANFSFDCDVVAKLLSIFFTQSQEVRMFDSCEL
jgi:hypothetical protein